MQLARNSHPANRSGITIIEVLTAMVVAMIGVFGIMVLIPFAIKQAETGLDFDDANRTARNAVELFEIGGHDRLLETVVDTDDDAVPDTTVFLPPWYAADSDGKVVRVGSPPNGVVMPPTPPGTDVYVIDPLAIGFKSLSVPPVDPPPPHYGQFPPLSSIDNPVSSYPYEPFPPIVDPGERFWFPRFPEANLGTYDPTIEPMIPTYPTLLEMTYPEAVRMCRSTDDLQFGEFDFDVTEMNTFAPSVPSSDLLPPRMYFDLDGNGLEIRRQSRGEMSWQMMLVPVKDDYVSMMPGEGSGNWKFRQFTLVYENRVLNALNGPPAMIMPIARVEAAGSFSPPRGVRRNGGVITLDKRVSDVRKNDWIMMVNRNRSDAEPGFEKQVGFYRAIDSVVDTNGISKITLDGPDFDFGPGPGPEQRTTYVVHLVNYDGADFLAPTPKLTRLGSVVNVYERTIRLKGNSDWNN